MATLYEQYAQVGKKLPSVQERQTLATNAGIKDYTGTAEQNTALGNYISTNKIDLSKPINASSLTTNSVVIPTNTKPDPFAGLGAGSSAITSNLTQPPYTPPAPTDPLQQYLKTNEGIEAPNQSNIQAELDKQYNIEQKTKETNALKAQIESNIAEAEAAKLGQENRLASFGAISGAQRDIDRQLAIKNLPLTAQYQASLGDLQGAQNTVTKLFTAKLADAQNQYENKKEIAKIAYQYATDKEKADILAKQRQEDINIEKEKSLNTYKQSLVKDLIDSGQANLIPQLTNAKTIDEVNNIAGKISRTAITKRDTSWQDIGGNRVLVDNQTGEIISKGTGTSNLADLPMAQQQGADKIEKIDSVLSNSTGINASSGMFQRYSLANKNKVLDWRADVGNILANLTTDSLGRIKASGVTFGALSDGERLLVGAAANALINAAEKDATGNLTGRFKMSEKKVKEELATIKKYAELDFKKRTGQSYEEFKNKANLSTQDLNEINKAYGINTTTQSFNPANFY